MEQGGQEGSVERALGDVMDRGQCRPRNGVGLFVQGKDEKIHLAVDPQGDVEKSNLDPSSGTEVKKQQDGAIDRLLAKLPHSVWKPNAVVPRDRRKATLYWGLLLVGYLVYIAIVSTEKAE